MHATPQQKTPKQKAKENAFLSRVTLCIHNQQNHCRPPHGKPCNYAHRLMDLQLPEEQSGDWASVWRDGKVDIRFWPDYRPNVASVQRFATQFQYELRWCPRRIPFWAWGHAVDLGLLTQTEVPDRVPFDFDWPNMQHEWHQRKQGGQRTAAIFTPTCPRTRRQNDLVAEWESLEEPAVAKEEPAVQEKKERNDEPAVPKQTQEEPVVAKEEPAVEEEEKNEKPAVPKQIQEEPAVAKKEPAVQEKEEKEAAAWEKKHRNLILLMERAPVQEQPTKFLQAEASSSSEQPYEMPVPRAEQPNSEQKKGQNKIRKA